MGTRRQCQERAAYAAGSSPDSGTRFRFARIARSGSVWPAALLAALVILGLLARESVAQVLDDHVQSHALRYAGMIERAFGRLHGHIRHRSTAATSWTGAAVPPAATGWEATWTQAGLRARYCDNFLVVYVEPAALKGTGRDHRAIQQARHSFLPERETGVRAPMLGWLEAATVRDAQGTLWPLPACALSAYTGVLPSGRAALAGEVIDPWLDLRERVTFETRERACPAGQHGAQRERRTVTQEFNAHGVAAGPQAFGPWEVSPGSWCRDDYVAFDVFTRPCSWFQGEPFNATLNGIETWRIPIEVTAAGRAFGGAEFVATTCWVPPGPVPVPTSTVADVQQSRTLDCPADHEGAIEQRRTETTATTTYPWGQAPLVSVEYTNWKEVSNTCTAIVDTQNDQRGNDGDMADGFVDGDPEPGDSNAGGRTGGNNFGGGDGNYGGPADK